MSQTRCRQEPAKSPKLFTRDAVAADSGLIDFINGHLFSFRDGVPVGQQQASRLVELEGGWHAIIHQTLQVLKPLLDPFLEFVDAIAVGGSLIGTDRFQDRLQLVAALIDHLEPLLGGREDGGQLLEAIAILLEPAIILQDRLRDQTG